MNARHWWTLRPRWGCYGIAAAFGLALLIVGLALPPRPAAADTFSPDSSGNCPTSTYTVPDGTRYLLVDAIGGAGAGGASYNSNNTGGSGGHGAEVTAVFPATPGQVLGVTVGHNGGLSDGKPGFPNGGNSANGDGGGSSFVTTSSTFSCPNNTSNSPDYGTVQRDEILVVAAGGGGGGGAETFGSGGNGGNAGANADFSGQSGSDAYHLSSDCDEGHGGSGASTTAAGNGGSGGCGTIVTGLGGVGVAGGLGGTYANTSLQAGGGGGGGWYGGGGGGNGGGFGSLGGAGGGAGSSHVDSSARVSGTGQDTSGKPAVTIAPYLTATTTARLSGTTSGNNWYTSAPTVTLTATAGEPLITVSSTYYALDNAACSATNLAACQSYSAPFSVSSEGLHTLTFFSFDSLGLDEPVESQTFSVTLNGAAVSNASIGTGTNPSASTGGATGVTVNGSGTGAVSTGVYSTNPVGPATFNSNGAYIDVMATGSLTSLTIKDCDLNGGTSVLWWNGAAWVPASNQTYDATTKCVTITVNSTTSPNLSQLTGTPFTNGSLPTGTTLTASSNPSLAGQAVTFTARVSCPASPDGSTVAFNDTSTSPPKPVGSAPVSGGVAVLRTSSLAVGAHSIVAVYAGNSFCAGSTSNTLARTVLPPTGAVTLTSSRNPSNLNQAVTFTATASCFSTGETIAFLDGTVQIGTGTLNASGVATLTTSSLKAGKHSITARYAGDATCLAGDSAPLTQTVNSLPTFGAAVLPTMQSVS